MFYSQEKLLQQLRARKVKLQQSKSERIIKLMSEGGRTPAPAPLTLPQHRLEAPRADSSLDALLARLESLEVRPHTREREGEREGRFVFSFQERKNEIGLMSVRDDGTMCVVKVRISLLRTQQMCRWHDQNRN